MAKEVDEIEALREQLAGLRGRRESDQARLEREAELARLRQEIEDEPHIVQAIEDYGAVGIEIAILRTPSGAVVVKRPRQAVWRQFSDAPQMKGAELHTLVQQCLVYPKGKLDTILDAHPAALEALGLLASKLASVDLEDAAGK